MPKAILLIGTYDTKQEELSFLADTLQGLGAKVTRMDVSVLGNTTVPCEISKHAVAAAAGGGPGADI